MISPWKLLPAFLKEPIFAMLLLLFAVFEPATTAASMAIERPGTIAAAPVFGPEHSGGWRRGEFFVSRGMPLQGQGKKVDPAPLRPQAIEAQPVSGQISHQRGKVRPGDEQRAKE